MDLAAEPDDTAVALLTWTAGGASVSEVICPAGDDAVLEAVARADKTGIDCPLGWPDAFVSFVGAHHVGPVPVTGVPADRAWRRGLAWRHTDEVVRGRTGLVPLSVSADRIGHTALRCAALQAALAARGVSVDRTGTGAIAEVYPAATLKIRDLPPRGCRWGSTNTCAATATTSWTRWSRRWRPGRWRSAGPPWRTGTWRGPKGGSRCRPGR